MFGKNMHIIIILFSILAVKIVIADDVTIATKDGKIKGKSIEFANKTIHAFLGIRYAEPPVGELRFAKPKPVHLWNETYDGTSYKHICWQKNAQQIHYMSEDCLFLNIWTPHDLKEHNKTLPVMFWIHGGGFVSGSGIYDSTAIAAHNVIVVTINYRLGVFGYLYAGNDEAPGNVGFWDQILALKWVRDNIASFGGNPKEITIFGESAGSISVGTLVISPESKNLFKRAILQSGTPYWEWMHSVPSSLLLSTHIQSAKKLSHDMGCADDSHWLKCLKTIDAQKIDFYNYPMMVIAFNTIWGDKIMPKTTQEALHSGDFYNGIEIMAGVTEDEGSVFVYPALAQYKNKTITKHQLKDMIHYLFPKQNFNFNEMYKHYLESIDETDQTHLKKSYASIYGDYLLTCPAYFFAKDYASYSPKNTAYFYILTYKTHNSTLTQEPWIGIPHGEDLRYVFGVPSLLPQQYSQEEKRFSEEVITLWTNFAKSGNPLLPIKFHSPISWPSFRQNEESEVIPKVFELNPHKFGDIRTELFKSNCDEFWKPYFIK